MKAETRTELTHFLDVRDDIVFAVLFGSAATGRETLESDVDVGVYLRDPKAQDPLSNLVKIEAETRYPGEDELWAGVERIVRREVDLVVLNRAPATVAADAVIEGETLRVHDEERYKSYLLRIFDVAEEYRDFIREFIEIRKRSQSRKLLLDPAGFRYLKRIGKPWSPSVPWKDLNH